LDDYACLRGSLLSWCLHVSRRPAAPIDLQRDVWRRWGFHRA